MNDLQRRHVMQFVGRAGLVLPYLVQGAWLSLSPAQALAQQLPLTTLTAAQGATLAALGEALLPGAAAAGVAHFVDQQLGGSADDCMLMVRYFSVPLPYAAFYRGGLDAIETLARQRQGKPFTECGADEKRALIAPLLGGQVEGWSGPPAPLFYLSLRSDAVDVVYGDPLGAKALALPYMEHILPPRAW